MFHIRCNSSRALGGGRERDDSLCFDLPISKDLKCLRRVSQHDVAECCAPPVSQGLRIMCPAVWAGRSNAGCHAPSQEGLSSGRSKALGSDSAGRHPCWQREAAELAYKRQGLGCECNVPSWVCFTAHCELALLTSSIRELSLWHFRKEEESFF